MTSVPRPLGLSAPSVEGPIVGSLLAAASADLAAEASSHLAWAPCGYKYCDRDSSMRSRPPVRCCASAHHSSSRAALLRRFPPMPLQTTRATRPRTRTNPAGERLRRTSRLARAAWLPPNRGRTVMIPQCAITQFPLREHRCVALIKLQSQMELYMRVRTVRIVASLRSTALTLESHGTGVRTPEWLCGERAASHTGVLRPVNANTSMLAAQSEALIQINAQPATPTLELHPLAFSRGAKSRLGSLCMKVMGAKV